jgi:hypothetical protein
MKHYDFPLTILAERLREQREIYPSLLKQDREALEAGAEALETIQRIDNLLVERDEGRPTIDVLIKIGRAIGRYPDILLEEEQ